MATPTINANPTDGPIGQPSVQPVEPTGGYVAGVCNIGPEEIARRRRTGWIGLVATVILGAILLAIGAPVWARLTIAAPLYAAAIGFIQARERFCVAFAAAGVTNFEGHGTIHRIDKPEARAADRRRAGWLIARAAAVAIVGALVFAATGI